MPPEAAGQATSNLLQYGALGSICVLLMVALVFLWRSKEKQSEAHRAELKDLMDRHIKKAEEFAENGQKLAAELNRVLEALSNRRRE